MEIKLFKQVGKQLTHWLLGDIEAAPQQIKGSGSVMSLADKLSLTKSSQSLPRSLD